MYMLKYVFKRIGLMLMTFFIIVVMLFVLIKLLPIVIDVQIGADASIMKALFEARGYYDPIPVQFFNFVRRIIVEGDFGIGVNMYAKQQVLDIYMSGYGTYEMCRFYNMNVSTLYTRRRNIRKRFNPF